MKMWTYSKGPKFQNFKKKLNTNGRKKKERCTEKQNIKEKQCGNN